MSSVTAKAVLVFFVKEEVSASHQCHRSIVKAQIQTSIICGHLLAKRLLIVLEHVAFEDVDEVAVAITELSKVSLHKSYELDISKLPRVWILFWSVCLFISVSLYLSTSMVLPRKMVIFKGYHHTQTSETVSPLK